MPEALELFERADELGDALETMAQEQCKSYEEVMRGGKRGTIYTFKDGSTLTLSETGYIGCEYK